LGALEFMLGAGGVLAAVATAELVERQRGAHARSQDEQSKVSFLDVEDLGLEGIGGPQQAAFPEIGFELDLTAEFKLQPLGNGERNTAFRANIRGRRYEYTQSKQGALSPAGFRVKPPCSADGSTIFRLASACNLGTDRTGRAEHAPDHRRSPVRTAVPVLAREGERSRQPRID